MHYILPKIAVSANSLKDAFFFFCKFLLSKHYVLRKLYFVWYLRYCISRHENTLPMIPYDLRGGSYHKRKREILKKTTLYITLEEKRAYWQKHDKKDKHLSLPTFEISLLLQGEILAAKCKIDKHLSYCSSSRRKRKKNVLLC